MKASVQPKRESASGMKAARVLLLGGFMGAGKTTLLLLLAKSLAAAGSKVAVITNGNRPGLIDTTIYESEGFAALEVTGGCLCSKNGGLVEPVTQLTASGANVILTEAWGTCTGLPGVLGTLQDRKEFAPARVTIVIDCSRAVSLLTSRGKFSDPVKTLFRTQIQEAELVLINKTDLVSREDLASVRAEVTTLNPAAQVLEISARAGAGLDAWFKLALQPARKVALASMEPATHGQSLLAGVHARVQLSSVRYFDASKVLRALAEKVQEQLSEAEAELTHLHMMINAEEDLGEIATINLGGNNSQPEIDRKVSEPLERGDLIINLSAEGDPESLANRLNGALHELMEENPNLFARLEESEHFTAGKAHGRSSVRR